MIRHLAKTRAPILAQTPAQALELIRVLDPAPALEPVPALALAVVIQAPAQVLVRAPIPALVLAPIQVLARALQAPLAVVVSPCLRQSPSIPCRRMTETATPTRSPVPMATTQHLRAVLASKTLRRPIPMASAPRAR